VSTCLYPLCRVGEISLRDIVEGIGFLLYNHELSNLPYPWIKEQQMASGKKSRTSRIPHGINTARKERNPLKV
jgi:hypothetical protein